MSAPLIVSIPHSLGRDEAMRRLKTGLSRAAASVPVLSVDEERWDGNRMSFRVRALGQVAAGHVDVEDASVRLEVTLPWLLQRFAEAAQVRHSEARTVAADQALTRRASRVRADALRLAWCRCGGFAFSTATGRLLNERGELNPVLAARDVAYPGQLDRRLQRPRRGQRAPALRERAQGSRHRDDDRCRGRGAVRRR